MSRTICDEFTISYGLRYEGLQHAMDIIIVPGDTLPLVSQDVAILKPFPHAMQNDDLVPEGALRDNCRYVLDAERKLGQFV